MKHLSNFGEKLTKKSRTFDMMSALSAATSGSNEVIPMGGGNPASIPVVNKIWQERLTEIIDNQNDFDKLISKYYMPVGKASYLGALANLFNDLYDWNLTEKNIAISNGSQTSYFILFNMLAGPAKNGLKKILFPMTPEYVGYGDQALNEDMFIGQKPLIEFIDKHSFRYKIDFANLHLTNDIAAVCLTRPSNPTGSIVTDEEIQQLYSLTRVNKSYLILDQAYAAPFPNITYKDVKPFWDEDVILTYSLSKLGLPSSRTGIIIAPEEVIKWFNLANLSLSLSVGSLGPMITTPLFINKEILNICNQYIRPYYIDRCAKARQLVKDFFNDDIDYYLHESEGAFFLWLWLKDLPITDMELFNLLMKSGVLCVPGSFFFDLYKKPWRHGNECIRITYCLDDNKLAQGIKIIADVIKKVYGK